MDFAWGNMNNFGGMGRMGMMPMRFEEQYHCYSMAYAEKAHLEGGDKILLPQSALDTLARLQVDYPLLFRLQSSDKGTQTHCGVLEFSAPEGSCYIPYWMMQNLLIEEGSLISVTNVSLPKATFVKLQPQHVDFLEISNPRAVLEHALRNFSCVTKGDVIQLPFNNKNYHFELKEVKPQDAACIIETDCNVDFDAPVGYKEPNTNSYHGINSSAGIMDDASKSQSMTSDSLVSTLANIPKQSAYANKNNSTASSSIVSGTGKGTDKDNEKNKTAPSLRIVDGKIIRATESSAVSTTSFTAHNTDNNNDTSITNQPYVNEESVSMMASQTGSTGVQRNSAIAVSAPEVNYWAVNAGDGARLDGKKPTVLKDKDGKEVDVRKLRAEAAAMRRLEEQKRLKDAAATSLGNNGNSSSITSMPSTGQMVNGKVVIEDTNDENGDGTVGTSGTSVTAKRKSRIGSKYSKLKNNARLI